MKALNPDVIRALTPIFLAVMGGMIGIAVLVMNKVDNTKVDPAGLGLASTAIAAAAGLAQPNKDTRQKD